MNDSFTKISVTLALFYLAVGCDGEQQQLEEMLEQQEQQQQKNSPDYAIVRPIPIELEQGMPDVKQKEMLTVADVTHPAQWLLTNYQQQSSHDPQRDVFYYSKLLTRITQNVHEDQRVVANRTVQIANKLNEQGIAISQEQLLNGFADYLEREADKRYVFGEIIGNYSNLRRQGHSHETSMKLLFQLLQKTG